MAFGVIKPILSSMIVIKLNSKKESFNFVKKKVPFDKENKELI